MMKVQVKIINKAGQSRGRWRRNGTVNKAHGHNEGGKFEKLGRVGEGRGGVRSGWLGL